MLALFKPLQSWQRGSRLCKT